MSFDPENPTSSAAAAQAQENEGTPKTEATPNAEPPQAAQESHGMTPPTPPVKLEAGHETAEAHAKTAAVDAEAAAAAEEAAGAEEMSKLIEQYSEPQESAANNEIIEVKVVAYTEHGVVVDVGGKTEGLIPAAEFSETDIPRPEPNATIEVQRTGEHKDGYVILSYQKVLRRRTWEKIEAAFKAKETVTGKVVESEDEAILALPELLTYDRRAVRKRFQERFTVARMTRDYVDLYRKLVTMPVTCPKEHSIRQEAQLNTNSNGNIIPVARLHKLTDVRRREELF